MAVKCKINGKHKRAPEKGACPECLTPDVPVTGKGFVGAHDVKADLGEGPQIPVTDAGSHVGDPRDAAVRREVEGRVVAEPVTVRYDAASRAYVHGNLTPRRDASVADPVEARGHGRAPVLVRGRAMAPVQPQGGYAAAAGTMAGPIGWERSEPEEFVGGHYGYLTDAQYKALTRTQQRHYWNRVGKQRRYAADQRAREASRVPVPVTGAGAGTRFLEGSDTERLMMTRPHA